MKHVYCLDRKRKVVRDCLGLEKQFVESSCFYLAYDDSIASVFS